MIRQNKIEEIIELIHKGFDLEILSLELDIPIEQLQLYKQQLQLKESEKETILKRKACNLRKKGNQSVSKQQYAKRTIQEPKKTNYEEVIERYKEKIAKNPQNSLNDRNLLAFAYFRAGRIDEARDELETLITQYSSYTAYRQLIHLEKCEENFEDAKLWAYDCLDKFPDSINIREQLISIAEEEKDGQEVVKQLKEIISIDPENKRGKKMLEKIDDEQR